MVQNRKAKKKKQRTKHRLLKGKADTISSTSAVTASDPSSSNAEDIGSDDLLKTKQSESQQKRIIEAEQYLTEWQKSQDRKESQWKFRTLINQWLIQHMYDPEKVSKITFGVLLQYLQSEKALERLKRIVNDAHHRCIRYKEYEKKHSRESSDTTDAASKDGIAEDNDESKTAWKQLTDHEKRKEYKRARRVLETLQEKVSS